MSLLKVFAWAAILESFSWIFLLMSMFFTYAVETSWGDGAISLSGRIHGYLVIIYVVLLFANLVRYRWPWPKILFDFLALLIPGLGFRVANNAFEEDRERSRAQAIA